MNLWNNYDNEEDNEFSDEEIGEYHDNARKREATCEHLHKTTVTEYLNQAAMKCRRTVVECEKCGKIFFHREDLITPLTDEQILRM